MRLYLDLNCFNRPFDDQAQQRVALETAAVLAILQRVIDGLDELAWSEILELENSRHPLADRRTEIGRWRHHSSGFVRVDEAVAALAGDIQQQGLAPLDAAHLACALSAGCEYFLSCDDRLVTRANRRPLGIAIVNPVDFPRHG